MKQRVLSEHRRKEGEQAKLQALANSSYLGFPYVIVYRTTSEIVEIIRIFHAARDRDPTNRRTYFNPVDCACS